MSNSDSLKLETISDLLHQATTLQRALVFRSPHGNGPISDGQKKVMGLVNEFLHTLANYGRGYCSEGSLQKEKARLLNGVQDIMPELSENDQKAIFDKLQEITYCAPCMTV